jgi:uncharacterized membrane protein YgdD (TMEM256/DUF423 family)
MLKHTWSIGSFLGMAAVGLGALGAHALKDDLSVAQLTSFETAVRYQFYHAMVLLVLYLAKDRLSVRKLNLAAAVFTAGVLCFSGSIYLLSCKDLFGLTTYKWLGPITPLGGILMMSGWAVLLISGYTKNNSE